MTMAKPGADELLTDGLDRVSEVAGFLRVSRSQVYRMLDEGLLPSVRIGNARRVPRRAVRELLLRQLGQKPN
jgi:excisionase family DNA binding protein